MMFSQATSEIVRALQPRAAALPEMATAVLILNAARRVEYANASAETLFAAIDPIGSTLTELIARCGARIGRKLSSVADGEGQAGLSPTRIIMGDGRLLDGELRALSGGGFVVSIDDVTDFVRESELGLRDPVTGLANRRLFQTELVEHIDAARRGGEQVALLLVDIDRFKGVNDSLGHSVGDALLCKIGERLKSATRDGDLVARLGGDAFAVIQSQVPQPSTAEALAARVADLVARAYVVKGHVVHVGASVGIAVYPEDGRGAETMLRGADLALYRVKAEGRGGFRFFQPGMDERVQARRELEVELRRALALKQMRVIYQPQVKPEDRRVTGFEALVRWEHPTRGSISPAEFIPLAEEIGLIDEIGEWVLRTACSDAAGWPADIGIAVNLSPVQFHGGRVIAMVREVLAATGLDPRRLELEVTEGALLRDSQVLLGEFEALTTLGVRISLDDFGTGYSSLSYLQRFPFSKIKIDQAFVRGIDANPQRRAIVRAIVSIAAALDMTTVAEGVETEAELACVRDEGCTAVQGYLTGRPVVAAEAAALL